jgi:hypothetical protein
MSDTDILLEDINCKFDAVLEAVGGIRQEMKDLAKLSDLDELKADVKTIKTVVTSQSHQLDNHENRINVLESA